MLLLALGVVLALPLPEVGIPLVLVGLRMLGRYFRWARRANEWLDERWARVRDRFHRLPFIGKATAVGVLAAVGVGLAWLLVTHL